MNARSKWQGHYDATSKRYTSMVRSNAMLRASAFKASSELMLQAVEQELARLEIRMMKGCN